MWPASHSAPTPTSVQAGVPAPAVPGRRDGNAWRAPPPFGGPGLPVQTPSRASQSLTVATDPVAQLILRAHLTSSTGLLRVLRDCSKASGQTMAPAEFQIRQDGPAVTRQGGVSPVPLYCWAEDHINRAEKRLEESRR
jgi:hypothetical protein